MVADNLVSAAGEPLSRARRSRWRADRFTCRYSFTDGSLIVSVQVYDTTADATGAYRSDLPKGRERTDLYGIGDVAHIDGRGALTAQKDNFILEVDPKTLPTRFDRDVVVWATTRAIFDCW